jgi:hypothetical protein
MASKEGNKRRRCSIELIGDRLVALARTAVAPASSGGKTADVRPPRLEFWRTPVQCGATRGHVSIARS